MSLLRMRTHHPEHMVFSHKLSKMSDKEEDKKQLDPEVDEEEEEEEEEESEEEEDEEGDTDSEFDDPPGYVDDITDEGGKFKFNMCGIHTRRL